MCELTGSLLAAVQGRGWRTHVDNKVTAVAYGQSQERQRERGDQVELWQLLAVAGIYGIHGSMTASVH